MVETAWVVVSVGDSPRLTKIAVRLLTASLNIVLVDVSWEVA